MNAAEIAGQPSFVVLQIGKRRFALPSDTVVELAPPVRLHRFPHASALLSGVIVRRGRIVPVYDAASLLVGNSSLTQRFYLIARRRVGESADFGAIPVNGECELASGEMLAPAQDRPAYVTGTLSVNGESIDVLDFTTLAALNVPVAGEPSRTELPS